MADFTISQEDWSLHKKGYEDQERHKEKVNETIKNNLSDLITEESIVTADGNNVIKIPIRSLDEYKIRYNYKKTSHVGQGKGDSQVGDVVARDGSEEEHKGNKNGGGDFSGNDYYETEISLAEVEEQLFSELELPNLEQKQAGVMEAESYEFNDIRKIGITGNIHKKKTLMAAFKRNALNGKSNFYPVIPEDLRYKSWNETKKPDTKALIIAMMDTSGSMGIWEKYMARSIYFWIKKFLEKKYDKVEIVYISHHTEAKVTTEYKFFHKGEAGGTICSSAYRKALELIRDKYPVSQYNIYAFHASDGDNLTSDNVKIIKLIDNLLDKCNMFGYIEINQYNRHSTLMSCLKNVKNEKFKYYILKQKSDVLYALKHYFRKEEKI